MLTTKTVYYYEDYSPNEEQLSITEDNGTIVNFELRNGAATARLQNDFFSNDYKAGPVLVRKGEYRFTVGNLEANALRTANAVASF